MCASGKRELGSSLARSNAVDSTQVRGAETTPKEFNSTAQGKPARRVTLGEE